MRDEQVSCGGGAHPVTYLPLEEGGFYTLADVGCVPAMH